MSLQANRRHAGKPFEIEWETAVSGSTLSLLTVFLECKSDPRDAAAWEELLRAFYPIIARISARMCRQWGVSDVESCKDLAQDVCLKLFQSIHAIPVSALESDASVTAYLKALVANTGRDVLRARFATKRGETHTVPLEDRLTSLAGQFNMEESERVTFLRQLDVLLDGSARDRAIFWLYYQQGLTAKEISLVPAIDLSAKGVESLLYRLTQGLKDRMGIKRKSTLAGESHS